MQEDDVAVGVARRVDDLQVIWRPRKLPWLLALQLDLPLAATQAVLSGPGACLPASYALKHATLLTLMEPLASASTLGTYMSGSQKSPEPGLWMCRKPTQPPRNFTLRKSGTEYHTCLLADLQGAGVKDAQHHVAGYRETASSLCALMGVALRGMYDALRPKLLCPLCVVRNCKNRELSTDNSQ